MLTQATLKYVRSLHSAHIAKREGKFLAEGVRMVSELLDAGFLPELLFVCKDTEQVRKLPISPTIVTQQEMARLSERESHTPILAVFPRRYLCLQAPRRGYTLFLESIQNPGNLGTIIRTAAWFGFEQIVCSPDSVSIYNTKVLQATMGTVAHIPVVYASFQELTALLPVNINIVATDLNGVALREIKVSPPTLFLFGNEGHGLSNALKKQAHQLLTIPRGRDGHGESLNIAAAVAIVASLTL